MSNPCEGGQGALALLRSAASLWTPSRRRGESWAFFPGWPSVMAGFPRGKPVTLIRSGPSDSPASRKGDGGRPRQFALFSRTRESASR